ncbi:3'-5' exonuclease [bacterium]|nr:3'-5' exonuclease [bacterium]
MYLFFDTETSGLPLNWKAPVAAVDNWPRMVQLAWQQVDGSGQLLREESFIIKPVGFVIPEEASKIHGITTETALKQGFDLGMVLSEFASVIGRSDVLVAHNIDFDEKIVGAEFVRMGIDHAMNGKRRVCTMRQSTDYCRIPGAYGYKWPTLTELHQTLFKTDFEEAHNASTDVAACVRCFFELQRLGIIGE